MKSIYDIALNSADGKPDFLKQYKGKVTMVVNTTVGCGNANQLEVLQWLQEKYGPDKFEIIAIPTNDYCGPGITKGKWSQGITCGMDSQKYGEDVYSTTFKFSEMVKSLPHPEVSLAFGGTPGHNGLGEPFGEPHDLYKEIKEQMQAIKKINKTTPEAHSTDYYSWWLNRGFDQGDTMGGNYEKYLIDQDGYVVKHFTCTVLNYDIERTLKNSKELKGEKAKIGMGRSLKIFEEEYAVVSQFIEDVLNGEKSVLNPANSKELVSA